MAEGPLVTVMVPSRGRVQKLKQSLESLADTIDSKHRAQIIVRADNDDKETLAFLEANPRMWSLLVHGDRFNGRGSLHDFYDDMCRMATGRFLIAWSDNFVMETKAWDLDISMYDSNDAYPLFLDAVLMTGHENVSLPIVHRSYHQILGRYSASCLSSMYVAEVLQPFFARVHRKSKIVVDLRSEHDQTFVDGMEQRHAEISTWPRKELQICIDDDRAKIRKFLEG